MSNPFSQDRTVHLSIEGIRPMLCMPTHRDLHALTVRSLLATQEALWQRQIPFHMEVGVGSSLVHHARSKLAWQFLQSNCNRLFWVDSDITWEAADFLRLLALSTKMPVVSAAYPVKRDPPEFLLSAVALDTDIPANEYGCVPVSGVGLGFTCIDRKVVEIIAEKSPKAIFPDVPDGPIPHLFRCDMAGDRARGEDMAWFADCREAGFDVWLDPNVELGHIGQKVFRASLKKYLAASPGQMDAVSSDAA